jgi:hypothetical protein
MGGGRLIAIVVAAMSVLAIAPAALGATPQGIYDDFADNGRFDQSYSEGDLRAALQNPALQNYPPRAVSTEVRQAIQRELGAQSQLETEAQPSGGLPFTGLDVALFAAAGALLLLAGASIRRFTRSRRSSS